MIDWNVTRDMAADCTCPRSEDGHPVVVVGGGCVSDGAGGAVSVVGGVVLVAGGGPSTLVVVVSVGAGSCFGVSVLTTTGGRGFARGGFAGYPMSGPLLLGIVIVPAIVPGCDCVVVVDDTCGSVKFVVVSAFVPVMPALGSAASPGALIVDVTADDD